MSADKTKRELRYAMTMDTRRCVGCGACVLSCKAENRVGPEGSRDWIVSETRGKFPNLTQQIRSERCNHCSNSPCVRACPTGASHIAAGGVIAVTQRKCSGCKVCIAACPYGARYVHATGYIDKCTFCFHRISRGKQPGCVEICPTRALTFGDRNDPGSEVAKLLASRKYRVLAPERGLEPNHFFLL
jgi:Fe-S-cluster-containing dehydrogenase component